jgi:2-polyprenyl-3-methyl-5-hydroxy-6-metoxy-1,4-benzoquinol methylase
LNEAKIPEIKFIKSSLLDANLQENYFDFIYVDSVVEHVLNPVEYLTKIKSLLRPGGVIYIGIPNEDCLSNSIRKLIFKLRERRKNQKK